LKLNIITNMNRSIFNIVSKSLLGLFLLFFGASCSKKKDGDVAGSGKSSITMNIDGKKWGSEINSLFAEPKTHSELGDYYNVQILGQSSGGQGNDDVSTSLNLYIVIPKSKFRNPKGTYRIVKQQEAKLGDASAVFTEAGSGVNNWYASYNPANPTQAVGTVEITDFEIGEQQIVGQSSGIEGYTKLSGTFKLDMYNIQVESGAPLKITEGKFDLRA